MKKILLSVLILLSLSQVKASDTLTVRQVFNFNVGDTFDYKTDCTYYSADGYSSAVYIHYNRFIVRSKSNSASQDTLMFGLEQEYPIDTFINITFTNLDSILFPVIPDTPVWGPDGEIYEDTSSGILSDGREFMIINYVNPGGYEKTNLAIGLGLVNYHKYSNWNFIDGGGDDYLDYDTTLVYHAKGNDISGTPYYLIDGLDNISTASIIHLYPNPTTEQIHLSFNDAGSDKAQFIITDILGQEVYSSTIMQSETVHDISRLSSGIYTWRVVSPQTPKGGFSTNSTETIKTGKVVKE